MFFSTEGRERFSAVFCLSAAERRFDSVHAFALAGIFLLEQARTQGDENENEFLGRCELIVTFSLKTTLSELLWWIKLFSYFKR